MTAQTRAKRAAPVPGAGAEIAALRAVAVASRAFRVATCRAIAKLRPRGEVEFFDTAAALDGALQRLADLPAPARKRKAPPTGSGAT